MKKETFLGQIRLVAIIVLWLLIFFIVFLVGTTFVNLVKPNIKTTIDFQPDSTR